MFSVSSGSLAVSDEIGFAYVHTCPVGKCFAAPLTCLCSNTRVSPSQDYPELTIGLWHRGPASFKLLSLWHFQLLALGPF